MLLSHLGNCEVELFMGPPIYECNWQGQNPRFTLVTGTWFGSGYVTADLGLLSLQYVEYLSGSQKTRAALHGTVGKSMKSYNGYTDMGSDVISSTCCQFSECKRAHRLRAHQTITIWNQNAHVACAIMDSFLI